MSLRRDGIIKPPIDELLTAVDSKYQLVIFASKRARQINAYYSDLGDGKIKKIRQKQPFTATVIAEPP